MKEIQLTDMEMGIISSEGIVSGRISNAIAEGPVTLIPPKPKTVKLSELPDGTIVEYDNGRWFVVDNSLYAKKGPVGDYYDEIRCFDSSIHQKIIESPKQVWEGGKCPVPDGVVVRIGYRDGDTNESETASGFRWSHIGLEYDIIWYQILRLADGWELVK